MKGIYDDIIHLPHPVSPNPKRMSRIDRAAQFSPFAALTGYDAAIQETGRLTDRQVELDVDEKIELNEKLRMLYKMQGQSPEITVTYFVPDDRKSGGAYECITGIVKKVEPHEQAIFMMDGTVVSFNRLRDIEGELFQPMERLYFFD